MNCVSYLFIYTIPSYILTRRMILKCVLYDLVYTSTTTQTGTVIEEYILPLSINPYHRSKSQDEKRIKETLQII